MSNDIYHAQLLAHFRQPKNQRSTDGANATSEAFNANCGDKVRVGLFIDNDQLQAVVHQSRACAICTASLSIMSEHLTGASLSSAIDQIEQVNLAVKGNAQWPPGCEALSGAAASVNRHKCILLGWQACAEAINQFNADSQ